MSGIVNWPNERITYEGGSINPLFISDILNADQNLIQAIIMLLGLPASGAEAFAILDGFTPISDTGFTGGICYMNGKLYICEDGLDINKYLVASETNEFNKLFGDNVVRPTYKIYYAVESNTQVADMPQFVGTMDEWRIGKLIDIKKTFKKYARNEITTTNGQTTADPESVYAPGLMTYHNFNLGRGNHTIKYYLNADTVNASIKVYIDTAATLKIYSSDEKELYSVTNSGGSAPATDLSFLLVRTTEDEDTWLLIENTTLL
jgi:hypothetical protein